MLLLLQGTSAHDKNEANCDNQMCGNVGPTFPIHLALFEIFLIKMSGFHHNNNFHNFDFIVILKLIWQALTNTVINLWVP
jgi:hypothetical protein